ncbi:MULTISPECIES: hypothetical protein [Thermus]|jgi:hypothetical protein|uniref:Uncharacterized protein n=1 Tax=Thermus brockianus TaxID=56956 RepID=A0A1J0LVL2_THEBO|nr:hypothetical protein [Thermus brockianus]APD10390.1 hypothetical protein A0O31_02365 [Thermus brockianus]
MEPDHTRVVARLSETRYLSRCACNRGTYHLHWDAATFRLTPEGLLFLAQVLKDLLARGGGGVVWLGAVGLRFQEAEGQDLLRLLQQGLVLPDALSMGYFRHLN